MSDPSDFIGRGIAFPLRVDQSGAIAMSSGPADIDSSIRMILTTAPGERLMREEFGCGLRRYLMKPNTVAIRALIQHDVSRALARWEPRVQVTAITVTGGGSGYTLAWAGACMIRAILEAGACNRPTIVPRSASSEGSLASTSTSSPRVRPVSIVRNTGRLSCIT